jgi:thiosulfate dehydrogenase (quinone) large subunit
MNSNSVSGSSGISGVKGLQGLQAKFATYDEKLRNGTIGAMRIVVGILWLANVEWKRPGDFGKDLGNGLYKYVNSAIENPVFGPYSWFVENVVAKNYTLFGWITLITEVLLAALLILGLFTRTAALAGAGLSVSILLSVLYYDKVYEWPWSYFLMIAIHLFVFATAAGEHWGLDGIKKRGTYKKAATTLACVAIVAGVLGLIVARNVDFAGKQGALLGWARWELKVLWFNPLSAIITALLGVLAFTTTRLSNVYLLVVPSAIFGLMVWQILSGTNLTAGVLGVLGVVSLASTRMPRPVAAWLPAGVFGLMALQVLAQWRYNRGQWTGGLFGGTGATLAFWLLLAIGFAFCARGQSKSING